MEGSALPAWQTIRIDWPLSVTRLTRCRTCVVQMIASTGNRATRNIWPTRRSIYVSSSFIHALERHLRTDAAMQRNPSTLFGLLLRQASVENSFKFQIFFCPVAESVRARRPAKMTMDESHPRITSGKIVGAERNAAWPVPGKRSRQGEGKRRNALVAVSGK